MNKNFIALIILSMVALAGAVATVIYLPAVWVAIVSLFILWGISFYLYIQLKRRTVQEFQKYNNKFVESGNAITDTLRVAFDNIKKNTRSLSQLQSPLAELKARIHRVEQAVQRLPNTTAKPSVQSNQQQKTNQKNERRNSSKAN